MKHAYTIKLSATRIAIADVCNIDGDPYYMVTRINVPQQFRGKGIGTRLLKQILDDADKEGVILVLWPQASDGLPTYILEEWYKRYGFKWEKMGRFGKCSSVSSSNAMIREPRKEAT